ncbi:MAG TPA: carboxypeptidase-like regulatory domain-containing protein [Thermoanaerobaculia bacterium]|jgi:hypothetical protein|nr:MAG: hypothetical protein BWX64_02384 [Acidobacteria bacterium ADurb.Bin051]HNU82758.1 carboxypeptidase-like regulatory domain-containing protein [Thermoanaerobaculia bacterium]
MIGLPLVAALALLAGAPALATSDPGPPEQAVAASPERPAARVWVETVPLRGPGRAKVLTFDSLADVPADLALDAPSLVCWGGQELRVDCRQYPSPGAAPSLATSDRGVIAHGQLILGGAPARGAIVGVFLEGVRATVPHFVPLSLDEETNQLMRRVGVGEDGTFELVPLAPGVYRLEIEWPGGAVTSSEPFELPPASRLTGDERSAGVGHARFSLGQIVGQEGVAVEVFVADLEGVPVAGAKVGAHQGSLPDLRLFESVADDRGRARLVGLDPAEATGISCWAPGYARSEEAYDHAPAEAVCSLGRLAGIRGAVAAEGQPLPGATALLRHAETRARTDESGEFELREIVPGRVDLVISAAGWRSHRERLDLHPGETLDVGLIELVAAEEWQLRIVDGETGEALSGASVESHELRSPLGVTDSEGLAVVVEEPGAAIRVGRLSDYPFTRHELPQSPPPDEEPVELALFPGGFLRVRAWDSEGDPCRFCTILIRSDDVRESVVTDPDGEAVSPLLPAARCSVSLEELRSEGRVVSRSSGSEIVHARVLPRQTVTVELGEARREVILRFEEPLGTWEPSLRSARHHASARPLGADRWVLKVPTREPAELRLHSGFSYVQIGLLDLEPARTEQRVQLPSGGVVLELGEEPPGVVELRGGEAAEPVAQIVAPGSVFHLPFIRPGQYLLVIDGKAGQLVDVPTEGLRHLDLSAQP